MITITSIVGNIRLDKKLGEAYQRLAGEKKVEKVVLSRTDAQRSRIRRTSDAGTDVAISLEQGFILKHGDVLFVDEDKMIVVEYEPEDVLGFKIKDELSSEQKAMIAIKLGHIIGNLHRPLCIKDNIAYMPLQSQSELSNIKKILEPIIHYIDIQQGKMIFETEEGVEVHTH